VRFNVLEVSMIQKSAVFAATVVLVLLLSLISDLQYLIPYKHLLFSRYLWVITGAAGVLFINLFALAYTVGRVVFLKDTGRKLRHVEKQLRSGDVVSRELADRLEKD
jgi:hypothetical protein